MPPQDEWDTKLFAPGRPLCTKLHATILVETRPHKRLNIFEGSLSDLLPMNIRTLIEDLIISSEFKDKHKKIIS